MSVSYTAIGWNRYKRRYDAVAAGMLAATVAVGVTVQMLLNQPPREVSAPITILRALGVCAIIMLHVVLAIGPACRLDRRLLPLLYNRRHLGVMLFLVALAHGVLSLLWYHGFGNVNPALSLLSSNTRFNSLREFPFEVPGIVGLVWLFMMAATSHDFWLKNLTPKVWKGLHMGVYGVYALLVLHIALGLLQGERSWVFPVALGSGVAALSLLHVAAGLKGRSADRTASPAGDEPGWIGVCDAADIPDSRARTICLPHAEGNRRPERVAIFRWDGQLSAVSSVCRHQGGPLGEGKVIGGCITCPWHGYQYRPGDGRAPAPFDDKLPTYRVRVNRGRVEIDRRALPPGTPVEPARLSEADTGAPPSGGVGATRSKP